VAGEALPAGGLKAGKLLEKGRGTMISLVRYPALMLGGLLAAGAALADAGEVERGREVAIETCWLCHVIGPDNLHGGIGSTPSFFLMGEKLDDYRERVLSLPDRLPHKGQELEVTIEDLEAVLAYIASLERP
jgi:mono/diheme cytochrome c family protein